MKDNVFLHLQICIFAHLHICRGCESTKNTYVDNTLLEGGAEDLVDVVAEEEVVADKEESIKDDAADHEAGTGDDHIAKDKQVKDEDEATES